MSEIAEAIAALMDNGEIPKRVTNRLLMATMLELGERLDRTEQALKDLGDRVAQIEAYPSLLNLLWRHPKTTISFIVTIFVLLTLAYKAGALSLF